MIRSLFALYGRTPSLTAYMLQSTEYDAAAYLKWYWRTQNFAKVMYRRTLDRTRRSRLILWGLRLAVAAQVATGLVMVVYGLHGPGHTEWVYFGAAVLLSYPVVWAHLAILPIVLAHLLVVRPERARQAAQAEEIFRKHPGKKIAVVGSYGKTSMKELLLTVLSQGKKVAATPANKNVISSHAKFARSLEGDEDVVIIEFGEGAPGDVAAMARMCHPDVAVVTGLAPAHLDKYKTLSAAADDIMSIATFVKPEAVYINGDSPELEPYIQSEFSTYSSAGTREWRVREPQLSVSGTHFTLLHGTRQLELKSGLLGMHQVGPLSAAAVLATKLGLSDAKIVAGIAATRPFEHRMQPYRLGGAWIIDDTYNGNLEGIRAGTALLRALEAKRKWYVTPGLVDQGNESERIHHKVGKLIAAAAPDVVVLMENSATTAIRAGLTEGGFSGELRLEHEPLQFYTNLEHFVSAGDLILMQNDWTDNYA